MKQVVLPQTNLSVSELGLGTAHFGVKQTEAESFAMLDLFLESGGNLIDTARVYSDWVPGERSRCERIIGDWLRVRGLVKSDRVVISTKGGHYAWGADGVNRVNATEVRKDVEASLRALGREQIELYWLHRDDEAAPVEEIVEFMEALVRAGTIRHWGVSNWKTGRMAAARAYATQCGVKGLVANQPFFNLGVWTAKPASDPTLVSMDAEMLEWHVREGVAMMPYSAQAAGFFTKAVAVLDAGGAGREKLSDERYSTPANWRAAELVRELAKAKGTNANGIVLAYAKQQPVCSVPLVGCQNIDQLRDSVAGAAVVLTTTEMERLEKTAMASAG